MTTPDPIDPFIECGEAAKTHINDAICAACEDNYESANLASAEALKLVQAMANVWGRRSPGAGAEHRFELRTIKVEYSD